MYNLSKALIDICKKYNIALLYIFGSQKENALKLINNEKVNAIDPLSDIDVGIVFLQDIEFINDRYKLYAKIYNDMEDIFMPYRLDLIFLQEKNSVFQCEALKGVCIYYYSETYKDMYEMKILQKAADFKYVLDKYNEEVLENY
ncbi:DNA polymerase subunit beta [Thermoanaerobacterium thermosaccharolyticum]|uniref:DNA polymerase subunit beta n=1 Tax=Thermoanaerobacterium thermosaccharolyticum TaxID=1517 RepID=A0A223HW71_THETR|nr:nucleotidyltransferase domain-containing protein [Thermoanaerobacterium thermosaccharolyticum]AST56534.1 DNA polymerase subunit beta [Thermoanaerobacterium thermosaccharolyticum]